MKKHLFVALFLITAATAAFTQEEKPAQYVFSIYFGGGSYYIDEAQIQELYKWLDGIPDIETHQISIHSHTDNIGSMEYNKMLSRYRSESTLQQLLLKGIPRDIIDIADFGEESPVYDNATWNGKLHNRRVDVIIKPLVM